MHGMLCKTAMIWTVLVDSAYKSAVCAYGMRRVCVCFCFLYVICDCALEFVSGDVLYLS